MVKIAKTAGLLLIVMGGLIACVGRGGGETAVPIPTPIPTDGQITINPDEQYQTIQGFGASGAWWTQDIGGWQDEKREQIIKLLFGRGLCRDVVAFS